MRHLAWFSLIFVGTALANPMAHIERPVANQQYVAAAPSPTPEMKMPFTANSQTKRAKAPKHPARSNPMAIYVKPKQIQSKPQQPIQRRYAQQQAQNTYQQPHQNSYEKPYQNQYHTNYPTRRPLQQYERNTAPTNVRNSAPNNSASQVDTTPRNTAPTTVPPNSASTAPSNAPRTIKNTVPNKDSSVYNNKAKATWFKNCLSAVTDKRIAASAKAFCSCGWQKISNGGINPKLFTSTNPVDIKRGNVLLNNISQACLMEVIQGR